MAFQDAPVRNRNDLVVHSDLANEVAAQLNPEIMRLERLLRSLTANPPTPQVNVAAPSVQVAAPQVTAEVEAGEVIITAEFPGMSELRDEIMGLRADLAGFQRALLAPSVRTVERDADGRILRIIDRRG
jgi:hypothetical protein